MVRRRTLSIFVISLACVAALVVAALAAAPPPNLGRALEAQKRLAAQRPDDPAVFNDLGNLYLLAHQPDEAEQAYRKAVSLDSKRVSALFNLGLLLQRRGQPKQALDFYRQVLDVQPEHAWAHYQIGALYEAGGQTAKAVGEYARAFSLDPQLAFREVNPQIVDNKLVTQAMLQAYRQGYGEPQVPAVYEDAPRIADLLVPPVATEPAKDAGKDAGKDAAAKPAQPQAPPARPQPGMAQPGAPGSTVIRPGDLDTRVTGQAAPQGAPGRRMQPTSRPQNPNVPRGMREWERPEPAVQAPSEGMAPQIPPQVPAPGQVITPPPGGVYYRPGYQSTGRLNFQVVPLSQRDARG
jgi:Tetratricopeptide repeat